LTSHPSFAELSKIIADFFDQTLRQPEPEEPPAGINSGKSRAD
jgi:hypothetical protein